jgi:hypothetical protein
VDITVETKNGEKVETIALNQSSVKFSIETDDQPVRLIVDKYNQTAKSNGGPFSIVSFYHELDKTLIVYGTDDEVSSNKEAAEALQQALRERYWNFTVPINADMKVTDAELGSRHVMLIGRPDSNRLVERFRRALPIDFGHRSFTVRGQDYAHPGSAVIAAAENPLNKRFSIVVLAGLSAESTLKAPPTFSHRRSTACEVLILPNAGKPKALVIPARDLVKDLAVTVGKK